MAIEITLVFLIPDSLINDFVGGGYNNNTVGEVDTWNSNDISKLNET